MSEPEDEADQCSRAWKSTAPPRPPSPATATTPAYTPPCALEQCGLKRLRIIGGAGAGRHNVERALAVAAEVETPIEDIVPLDRLHDAYRRLADGEVAGKLVVDPSLQ